MYTQVHLYIYAFGRRFYIGIVIIWHISSGNCLNIIGFHQDVDHIIHIGVDIVTDMKKAEHPPIITEPISEIQVYTLHLDALPILILILMNPSL